MNKLVELARRTVRNYTEHFARQAQAELILELADEIQRLGKAIERMEDWCVESRNYDALQKFAELEAVQTERNPNESA